MRGLVTQRKEVYAATEVGPRSKRHQEGGHAECQALVGNAREAAQREGHAVRNRLGPHDHNGVDGSAHEARDGDARKDHGPSAGAGPARYQVDQKRGEKRADKGHGLPEHRMSREPERRHKPEQARPGVDAHHARRREVVVERGLQEEAGAGKRCTAAHARYHTGKAHAQEDERGRGVRGAAGGKGRERLERLARAQGCGARKERGQRDEHERNGAQNARPAALLACTLSPMGHVATPLARGGRGCRSMPLPSVRWACTQRGPWAGH